MMILKQKALDIVEHAEPNLSIIGLFGVLGYPAYYIIWTYIFPQPYENLQLRLLCAAISLPWVFYRFYPKPLKDYFPLYFFISLFFVIPFFFSFMMLKNEWSEVWSMSLLSGLFLLTLVLFDWVIICLITGAGFIAAYFTVFLLDGQVSFNHYHPEYIPIFLFSISGGIVANHKRELAHKTKISFLRSLSGSIAHEMRNPLNSITNAIALIQARLPEKPENNSDNESYSISNHGLVSIHNVIKDSSNTLNRANKIIDSILTSMEGGKVPTRGFICIRSGSAIDAAIDNFPFHDPEEKKLIRVNKIKDFYFFGDRDLFFYVLFNLLKNAIFYKNKPGFGIEITTDTNDSGNSIKVRDTGPGISANKRERIFESFYTSNKAGGNGLGLSFCRRVIDAFGGKIVCDSKEGKWTEFTITLPKYDSKKIREIKDKILRGKKILIADDQTGNRMILAKYISELHCQFDLAENGSQAFSLLSKKRYDLIFMDYEMPFLNGDHVVKLIRSARDINPSLALHYLYAPIIGITALHETEAESRARKCGMNEFLIKPVKKIQVSQILEKYFFTEEPSITNNRDDVLNGKRILLVDDNETSRKFMTMVLQHYGCCIGQAVHGRAAIDYLEKEDFDLVLMDIEMPVMNGIEAAKAIRSGTYFNRFISYKTIPIIALTGNTDEQSSLSIQEAGMNYHLSKPVFKDELISAINVILKNSTFANKAMNNHQSHKPEQGNAEFWSAVESEKILDRSIINSLQEIGGDELIATLFETFIADSDNLIKKLTDAVAEKDMKHFDHLMHTFKGSSGSVGANKIYVLTKHINEFSRVGKWPDNSAWMQILTTVYAETIKEMQKLYSA